jgi:hypothetical protein
MGKEGECARKEEGERYGDDVTNGFGDDVDVFLV